MRMPRPVSLLLFAMAAVSTLDAQSRPSAPAAGFALTVDSIMRGPDLVGYPPENLRWSADSRTLFFDWRRPGEDEASTYSVGRDGGTPVKLSDEQKKSVPPPNGRWDTAHRRVVFADHGDIVLLDAAGARRMITPTAAT